MIEHALARLGLDADDRRVLATVLTVLSLASGVALVLALVLGVAVRLFLLTSGLH